MLKAFELPKLSDESSLNGSGVSSKGKTVSRINHGKILAINVKYYTRKVTH